MRRLIPMLIAAAMAVAVLGADNSTPPRWEQVTSVATEIPDDGIDVAVRDNYIYVNTPRQVNVKVFTILGQLVSQGNLPPGVSRLRVNARGIYILKAGTVTRRVTI